MVCRRVPYAPRGFAVRSGRPGRAIHPGALRASQAVLSEFDGAVSTPDVPQRRRGGPFFVAQQAFLRQKNALTVQHSSMSDFHFALNGVSRGRECGAVTRERSGNDA